MKRRTEITTGALMREDPRQPVRQLIDWAAVEHEAREHFVNLLRLDTTNPPGDEILAARYLARALDKAGIEAHLEEPAPGRANLVARLSAGAPERGLLLSAHTDVVPAEPEHWRHPPFAAVQEDGLIYGRGAVDMKHMVAYCLMTMALLRRHGVKLARDVVFAAVADEEAGSRNGSLWLAEHRPELIQAQYALNEVGGFSITVGNKRVYPIQVAEKGFLWLRVSARGAPGHGSLPHGDNAVVKIARVIDKLSRRRLPLHLHPAAARFLDALARALGLPAGLALRAAQNGWLHDLVLDRVLPDPEQVKVFGAMLHNTACPTMLESGTKENVIPSEASVTLDCRLLPGFNNDQFLHELKTFLGDTSDLTFEILASGQPAQASIATPLYRHLEANLQRRDPGCLVTPYLVTGYTDAKAYSEIGIETYGFTPLKMPPGLVFSKLFHAHDERVPVDAFNWGLRTFYETVMSFACSATEG